MEGESIPVEAWKWLQQDWIYIGKKRVPEAKEITESNDHMVYWKVLDGQVGIFHRDQKTTVPAGRSVLLMPGTFRREFPPANRIISLRLRWQWPTGQPLFPDAPPLLPEAAECASLEGQMERLLQWAEASRHEARDICTSWQQFRVLPYQCDARDWMILQEILASLQTGLLRILENHRRSMTLFHVTDDRILHALTRIQRHPLSQPLSVDEMASSIGLSRSRFSALFQSQTGCTPAAVFRQRKRQQIRQLLQFSDRPIKQIAYENGFASLPLFCDWCRRSFNTSPSGLRQRPTTID